LLTHLGSIQKLRYSNDSLKRYERLSALRQRAGRLDVLDGKRLEACVDRQLGYCNVDSVCRKVSDLAVIMAASKEVDGYGRPEGHMAQVSQGTRGRYTAPTNTVTTVQNSPAHFAACGCLATSLV
jgi:hypothetical protein